MKAGDVATKAGRMEDCAPCYDSDSIYGASDLAECIVAATVEFC